MSRPSPPTTIPAIVTSNLDDIAALLARRRYECNLSQLDLDHCTGLADGHVAKIEAGWRGLGRVSLPTIAQALGVQLEVRLVADPNIRIAEPLHPNAGLIRQK